FFFSSRRRHTRWPRDWSSDVCSSDLTILVIFLLLNFSATGEIFFIQKNLKLPEATHFKPLEGLPLITVSAAGVTLEAENVGDNRSEERRVGKEGRYWRWGEYCKERVS